MSAMEVDLSRIAEGVNRYEFEAGPEELDLEEENSVFRKKVRASLMITRTGTTLTLRGEVNAVVERTCSRCLDKFEDRVEGQFFEAAQLDGDMLQALDDQYDSDPEFLSANQGFLTIDTLVRETVLVLSPMKPICRSGCKGICPICGTDRNRKDCECDTRPIHPSWEAVRKLTENRKERE